MTTVVVLVLLVVAVGGAVAVLRNRSEQGIESGISSFRREMRALAPHDGDPDPATAPRPHRPVDQDPGVHLLGDRPEAASPGRSLPGPDTDPAPVDEDPVEDASPDDPGPVR